MAADDILHDLSPVLKHYKDGRIEKLIHQELPASLDPTTAVQSKDVQISPETNLSARLYLPPSAAADPTKKLPVLLYFHGGAFVIESAFSEKYHKHLNLLVSESNAIAVSVNYRLAPEHPLPAAYDDSWLSLNWIASDSADEWIKQYADLNRVYLGGDSAGANISNYVAIRFGSEKIDGIHLSGIVLDCPYFGGEDPIGSEATEYIADKSYGDKLWCYACPSGSGVDDPRFNPGKDPKLCDLACDRLLVYVAEKDFLKVRGLYYVQVLKESGWSGEIEVVDVKGENHVFSVLSSESENAMAMRKRVGDFIKGV